VNLLQGTPGGAAVLHVFHLTNSKLFVNDLKTHLRLMSVNNRRSKIIADVFPPLHCVNTHLNASDQQAAKLLLS